MFEHPIKKSFILELLKNSITIVNKIASIDYFMERKQDGELIF